MENFAMNWKSFIQIGKGDKSREMKKEKERKKICLLNEKWMHKRTNSMNEWNGYRGSAGSFGDIVMDFLI